MHDVCYSACAVLSKDYRMSSKTVGAAQAKRQPMVARQTQMFVHVSAAVPDEQSLCLKQAADTLLGCSVTSTWLQPERC